MAGTKNHTIPEYFAQLVPPSAGAVRRVDPRVREYTPAWHNGGWDVLQLTLAVGMCENIAYREVPAAIIVPRIDLCSPYTGDHMVACQATRQIIYAASGCAASAISITGQNRPGLVPRPADGCDIRCVNPAHAVLAYPVPVVRSPAPRSRPTGSKYGARAAILLGTGATLEQAAHELGLRPARLRHILWKK